MTLACAVGAVLPCAAYAQRPAAQNPRQDPDQRQDPDERARGEQPETGDASEDGATLLLTPSNLELTRGTTLRLSLSVLGADDLRRLPVTVRFNPEVLRFASVTLGAAWDNQPKPVLLHDASRAGELIIGLGLIDRDASGISGSVELLELAFETIGSGDAALRLEDFAAITAGSRILPLAGASAKIVIR
jgi:hypothetical protein